MIGVWACQPSTPKESIESEISGLSSKIDYLNLRINKLEKSVESFRRTLDENEKNSRQARADQSVTIEDLRTEVKSLGGSVDVLRHDLDQISQNNQKIREDLDTRVTELDQKVAELQAQAIRAESAPSKGGVSRGKGDRPEDATRYNQILRLFRTKKNYDAAIGQFRDFIRDYSKSPLSANAQYWIGEGYYAKEDYARAITEFQVVVEKYPQGEKVCDALLKQALAFLELKEPGKARLFLMEVGERCPKTPAAAKASERLTKLAAPEPKK